MIAGEVIASQTIASQTIKNETIASQTYKRQPNPIDPAEFKFVFYHMFTYSVYFITFCRISSTINTRILK